LARLLGLVFVISMLLAAGCGGGAAGGAGGGGGGSIAQNFDLSEAEFTVGSKEFTEQLILGQITKQALEAAGASVNDQIGLAGSAAARQALLSSEIDMYWEYTGTGWITHLGETKPIPNSRKQYEAVAERDLEENNVRWLPPAPANNTYAVAVRGEAYGDLGVKKLSDFGTLIEERPEEATLCTDSEFATRDDGLPGVEKAYGFEFPNENIFELNEGVIYDATDKGDPCNFGMVFETDGRIEALGLRVIEDDKGFFPVYNPSLTVRKEVVEEYPQLVDLFAPITEKLDTKTLQQFNAAVDVDGQLPEEVAEEWLRENGFVG
jgi:osmoprotectant transport system substrate-binding protein